MYQNFININKVNKDLKMMVQSLSTEYERLKAKVETLS